MNDIFHDADAFAKRQRFQGKRGCRKAIPPEARLVPDPVYVHCVWTGHDKRGRHVGHAYSVNRNAAACHLAFRVVKQSKSPYKTKYLDVTAFRTKGAAYRCAQRRAMAALNCTADRVPWGLTVLRLNEGRR